MKLRNEYPQEKFDDDKFLIEVSPKDLVNLAYSIYGSDGLSIFKARDFINDKCKESK